MKPVQTPLVSAVIVNWNGRPWLGRCLDSLLDQTYGNLEIIAVDNASTDGSADFLSEEYPGIKLVRSDRNLGFAGGNNLGVSEAAGRYLLLLNNDTWLEKNCIEKLLSTLLDGELDVVGPAYAGYEDNQVSETVYTIDIFGHPVFLPPARADKRFYLTGACLLLSRELYQQSGGFDEDFFMYVEDVDWCWRLNLTGKKLGAAPLAVVHHYEGAGTGRGLSRERFLWRNTNTLQCLIKNYSLVSLIFILPLLLAKNIAQTLILFLVLKPGLAVTYPSAWLLNLKFIGRTWRKRQAIRAARIVGEVMIIKKMYIGLGELRHLRMFLSQPKDGT